MQYIEKTTQICSIIQYKHEIAYLIGLGDEGGGVEAGNRRKWRKKIERRGRNSPAEWRKWRSGVLSRWVRIYSNNYSRRNKKFVGYSPTLADDKTLISSAKVQL